MRSRPPPDDVLTEFGLAARAPVLLPGGEGRSWRVDDVVLKPVGRPAEAEQVAELVAGLPESDAVRLPRPVRTRSGRWVSAGWTAWSWVAGATGTDRWPEVVAAGAALHTVWRDAARPAFLDERDDAWAVGDRTAWQERPLLVENGELRGVAATFAARLRPCAEAAQLVHGDLTGNVLVADDLPPAVIDLSLYWRPPSWASAVVVADALAWHGAAGDVVGLVPGPDPVAMVARAALYRLVTSDALASSLRAGRRARLAADAVAYGRVADALRSADGTTA